MPVTIWTKLGSAIPLASDWFGSEHVTQFWTWATERHCQDWESIFHPNFRYSGNTLLKKKKEKRLIYLFLFLTVLGLCCYTRAFSSCGERGLLFVTCAGLHWGGFSHCRAWALETQALEVAVHGLISCDTWGLLASWHVGSSQTRGQSNILCIAFLTIGPPGKPPLEMFLLKLLQC